MIPYKNRRVAGNTTLPNAMNVDKSIINMYR